LTGQEKPSTLHHRRRTIRLADYDYTQPGAYFVTIGTWQNEYFFSEIIDGTVLLNEIGEIVRDEWLKTPVM
jgi:putative transposase